MSEIVQVVFDETAYPHQLEVTDIHEAYWQHLGTELFDIEELLELESIGG